MQHLLRTRDCLNCGKRTIEINGLMLHCGYAWWNTDAGIKISSDPYSSKFLILQRLTATPFEVVPKGELIAFAYGLNIPKKDYPQYYDRLKRSILLLGNQLRKSRTSPRVKIITHFKVGYELTFNQVFTPQRYTGYEGNVRRQARNTNTTSSLTKAAVRTGQDFSSNAD